MPRWLSLVVLLILAASGGAAPLQAQEGEVEERCFAETGYCIAGPVRAFWEQHGGLSVFGLPISPQQVEQVEAQTLTVQWFERTRLEIHPQGVAIGRLGAAALAQQGRDWHAAPQSAPQPGCLFVPQTGQNICEPILSAWRALGLELDGAPGKSQQESLALSGLPLGPAQPEVLADGRRYTVQWFERVRFEVHADRVLLGLLGRELYPALSQVVAAPAAGPLPRFEPGACPFGGPGVGGLECGYLTVLEDRSQPAGRTIRLPVAIFRTSSTTPAPDPVVYLAGGPGGAALKNAPLLFQVFAPFLQHRDLIIFDQRGTGQAEPALECPEYTALQYEQLDQQPAPQAAIEAEASALLRCRERLAASGINLAAYTSAASAADVNDLRIALGYGQWNLLGISYGTRLALTTMRDYPQGIRSVILDSSYPLQVDLYSSLPENMHRVLSTLFAGCAAAPDCRAAYPNLESTFYELVNRLQANPVLLPVANPTTGQVQEVLVDGDRLLALTFQMLYNQETLVLLPRMIQDASQGSYVTMSLLLALQLGLIEEITMGMHYSVQCSEEVFFTSAEQLRAAVDAFPRLQPYFQSSLNGSAALLPFCESWRTQPPPALENAPVQSSIPTLVLAGQYDPITPPAWGQLAAQSLPTSYVYTFPGLAHGISPTGGCAADVIRAFLAAPTSAPDASCIGGMGAPPFVVLPF